MDKIKKFFRLTVHTMNKYAENEVRRMSIQHYNDKQLQGIAEECQEFEHIINAMGYGYSLLNVSELDFARRCSDCIHWAGGNCIILENEMNHWVE